MRNLKLDRWQQQQIQNLQTPKSNGKNQKQNLHNLFWRLIREKKITKYMRMGREGGNGEEHLEIARYEFEHCLPSTIWE